jgi:hypothetical protein
VTTEHRPTDRVRYRFSPLERRGVIAGWRGGQIAAVAAGLIVGVLAVRSRPSAGGVALAVVGTGVGVAVAFWPVHGRTGDQWFPLVLRWVWTGGLGTRRQLAQAPGNGHQLIVATRARASTGARDAHPPGHSPGQATDQGEGARRNEVVDVRRIPEAFRSVGRRTVFDGVDIVAVPLGGDTSAPELGVVVDGPSRTATAVLAVRGHSFALLGPSDQDARIGAWARTLSSMAREGSEVHRVQWIESCLPDDGTAVRRYRADHALLGPESAAGRSYQALVDGAAPVTRRHRVYVSLSVRTSRPFRTGRSARKGAAATVDVLPREIHMLHRALDGADITVDGALGPGALSRVISEAIAPVDANSDGAAANGPGDRIDRRMGGQTEGPDGAPVGRWPWPLAIEPSWDAVRTDATWHAIYWIAEWPRVDVTPDFLGPLLFSPLRRSLSMVMEPVSPLRAARQVAQARTADLADGELRRRGGFLVTARHRRQKESVEDRDTELADGHAQYRFSGYLTVTADTRSELAACCSSVEQAAGQSGLELRLLYGTQDAAFACSLPLGRGLS